MTSGNFRITSMDTMDIVRTLWFLRKWRGLMMRYTGHAYENMINDHDNGYLELLIQYNSLPCPTMTWLSPSWLYQFKTSCHKHAMLMLMQVCGVVWRICGAEQKHSVSKARLIMTAHSHCMDSWLFCAKLCTNPKILSNLVPTVQKVLRMRLDYKLMFLLVYKYAIRSHNYVC